MERDIQEGAVIDVARLCKSYRAAEPGRGSWRTFLRPRRREVAAVKDISFTIQHGERVAFIGPNGAGKSTTLKMLTGILYPSSGSARVLGLVPWAERKKLARRIGSIFGQRSQLWYHLPAGETFDLLARMYDLDPAAYRTWRGELEELFSLGALLGKPVRQLSLGERMRCEIASSLLHRPEVLFLDEPTIGLDVTAKAIIRSLMRRISEQTGMTVLLTSHDTGDVEGVCDRVIVINEGALILDAGLATLRRGYIRQKMVTVQSGHEQPELQLSGVRQIKVEPYKLQLEVDLEVTAIETVVQELLRSGAMHDLTVEDPPLEEIIKKIFAQRVPR